MEKYGYFKNFAELKVLWGSCAEEDIYTGLSFT